MHQSRIADRSIGIGIHIEYSPKHGYFSKMSLHHKRMILIRHNIQIGFAFQTYNSAFTGKTYRISQFGTGIQMNRSSICEDYGVFTPTRYNQFGVWSYILMSSYFSSLPNE